MNGRLLEGVWELLLAGSLLGGIMIFTLHWVLR